MLQRSVGRRPLCSYQSPALHPLASLLALAVGAGCYVAPPPAPLAPLTNGRVVGADGGATTSASVPQLPPRTGPVTVASCVPAASAGRPAAMPVAAFGGGAAAASDGRIYVVGTTAFGGVGQTVVQAYSPATNTWTQVPPLPSAPQGEPEVVSADGIVFVFDMGFGGYGYDPATNAWYAAAPLPLQRSNGGATATSDGKVYVLGGLSSQGGASSAASVLDPHPRQLDGAPHHAVRR